MIYGFAKIQPWTGDVCWMLGKKGQTSTEVPKRGHIINTKLPEEQEIESNK